MTFTADLPKKDGGMPISGWRIEYEEDNDHTESGVLSIGLGRHYRFVHCILSDVLVMCIELTYFSFCSFSLSM